MVFLAFSKKNKERKDREEHKPKHLSPDVSGGVGVFHVKGWGPKSSVCPSKPGKSNFFGAISHIPGFCRDIPELPEKFERNKYVFNFWPYISELQAHPNIIWHPPPQTPLGCPLRWGYELGWVCSCYYNNLQERVRGCEFVCECVFAFALL